MNASNSQDVERTPCDYCGTPVPDLWFGVEIQRPKPTTNGLATPYSGDWLDLIFCNQEHAALWMQKPLPALDPVAPDPREPRRRSWRHRLVDPFIAVCVLVAVALVGVGLFTVVRWIIER